MIPYGRQDISEADLAAVTEVLRSDWLTQGPVVPRFEAAVAARCGAAHAVAVNSATSALHLACLALGLGPGDLLWTTPTTFVASANCGLYCGASVDFVDIDPVSYNLCPRKLEEKLRDAAARGRLPKIVIPVHLCGQPCDMAALHALAQRFGFRIIEDASHAIGARYLGETVGNCRFSDITVFSFHPVKIITTGEGGLALTNDAQLARQMTLRRSHGITREADEMSREADGPWYYEQIVLGFNYRMTELQAALGMSQLERLDGFVAYRQALAARYDRLLATLPVTLPRQAAGSESARHLYVIRLHDADRHRAVFEALRARGIGVNLHYTPVHLQPWFRAMGFAPGQFPQAESYAREAITLPLYATLSEAQQDEVVATLREVLA